jgi:hypothetical protein
MTLPPDAPVPDAIEQATSVDDEPEEIVHLARDLDVPEADALDQAREVPLDDDHER